jgi:ABC-2 type transport system permease protein
MNKIITVGTREFVETVRTKAFLIGVILLPGLILAFVFGAQWFQKLAESTEVPPRHVVLLDGTGVLEAEVQKQVEKFDQENPARQIVLTSQPADTDVAPLAAQVRAGKLYAYLRIPPDAIAGTAVCQLGRADQQLQSLRELSNIVTTAINNARYRASEPPIDPQAVAAVADRGVEVVSVDVSTGLATGKQQMFVRVVVPFAIMFLLFMGIMQISFGLLTSVIEEKSSRIVEVLLAAVSPLQLMTGKIVGMVMVGITVLLVWGGVGYTAIYASGYGGYVSGPMLFYTSLYFIPGFLLFAAILGAIGSACNTLKEAQSMASPITILNLIPMVLWLPISQNPGALMPTILSYIPPMTPFVMVLRLAADPRTPLWQIATTQALLWASVLATIWAAAKIFRVGVLMYGKPPSLRELLRWVRYA